VISRPADPKGSITVSGTRVDRRGFLRSATTGATLATVTGASALAAPAQAQPASRRKKNRQGSAATFRWFGTSGWRIDVGSRTLLVDPYLSRFRTGLAEGKFDPGTRLTVDTAVVDQHVGKPETVLVTHSHWDHFNDVPYISGTAGARVIGTMTTYNLALAYGVASSRLSPVKGGEVLDFGDYTVEVVSSLHSRNAAYSLAFPGVRLSRPEKPQTIADLPEGDTLAFQVAIKGGPSVFFMGASDFAERNLTGLAPDVAMIAIPASDATHDYTARLLTALDRPATVVPVHWDNFEVPLRNPPTPDTVAKPHLDAFVETVRRISPRTKVITPDYLTSYTFG
jgi:L-ascorbate metabolism protein UlaG (beta-lactamase superfamily)